MRRMIPVSAMLIAAFAVQAQTPAPATGGVETEWDLQKLLGALSAGTRRMKPIMDRSNPEAWKDSQAAQSYIPQWKAAQSELQYLDITAEKLAKEPERLPVALETFFRLQALENSVSSLIEGIRKYQNPAVADLLQGALVENQNNRERLKRYVTELAQTKEEEFKVMDKEAQRCRGMMSRQPPGAVKPRSTR
jgi:hypothetical protein